MNFIEEVVKQDLCDENIPRSWLGMLVILVYFTLALIWRGEPLYSERLWVAMGVASLAVATTILHVYLIQVEKVRGRRVRVAARALAKVLKTSTSDVLVSNRTRLSILAHRRIHNERGPEVNNLYYILRHYGLVE